MPSIKDFDAVASSANTFEFEYINERGKNTDFFITIIGEQAESVTKKVLSKINQERIQNQQLKKRGKDEIFKPIEDIFDDNIENVAACVVDWRGVDEVFSPELAFQVLKNNKLIYDQVKKESENLANFTKSK